MALTLFDGLRNHRQRILIKGASDLFTGLVRAPEPIGDMPPHNPFQRHFARSTACPAWDAPDLPETASRW